MAEERVVKITIDAREFRKQSKQINDNLEKMRRQAQRTSDSIVGIVSGFLAFEGVQWTREFIAATAEVERMDSVMRGALGGTEEFAEGLEFLRGLAAELSLPLGDMQEGFSAMAAAGGVVDLEMGQIEEIFRGLAVSAAAFQVSGAELNLMLQGAQQLAGSTNVNMEDLNQVFQRIPNALGPAIDATREMTGDLDLTAQEMKKLVAEGEIATDEFLPLFAQKLEELNLPAAQGNTETFRASLNDLNTALQEMRRTLVDAGLLDALAELISALTEAAVATRVLFKAFSESSTLEGFIEGLDLLGAAVDDVTAKAPALANFFNIMTNPAGTFLGTASRALGTLADQVDEVTDIDDAFWKAQDAEQERLMRGFVPSGPSQADLLREQFEFAGGAFEAPRISRVGGGGGRATVEPVQEVEDYTAAVARLRAQLDPLTAAQMDYTESMILLNQALEAGQISQQEFGITAGLVAEQLHEATQDLEETAFDLPQLADDVGVAFAAAFGDMISGASSFEDALASLESQLINVITQMLIVQPLQQALGGVLGGLSLPGLADGGTLQAGQAAIVGERGPELFVPRTSGTVVPNEAMATPTVVINFNGSVTGEGLRQSAQQIAGVVGGQTSRALQRNG